MRSLLAIAALAAAVLVANPASSAPRLDGPGNPVAANSASSEAVTSRIVRLSSLGSPDSRSVISDPAGDQGAGPTYGDCLKAGVTSSGTNMIVFEKINGSFPPQPVSDIATWSWRFDTDLNPQTGYQQYPYIGIEWEILILASGSSWTVDKWSQTTGYQPVPGARIVTRHESTGDLVGVRFPASEIGSPTQSNWIAWNGMYPTWEDVAPDSTVAYWHQ